MFNIFELCSDPKGFDKLQNIKNNLLKTKEEKEEEDRREFIKNYRKHHIFSSYEEALNWSIENLNKGIEWHCKTLFWEEDKQKFKSYEQEYSLDGVMCYDVIRYYTKEELLKEIEEHIKYYNSKYPEKANTKWWLDEYGKLSYVYIEK